MLATQGEKTTHIDMKRDKGMLGEAVAHDIQYNKPGHVRHYQLITLINLVFVSNKPKTETHYRKRCCKAFVNAQIQLS